MLLAPHVRESTVPLVVISMLLLSGSIGDAVASDGESGNPYRQCAMFGIPEGELLVWRGEVSFDQSKSGRFEGGSSSEESTVSVYYDESFEARAVARVCAVSCGPFGVLQGKIQSSDFIYHKTDQYSARSASADCANGGTASPGDSRTIDGTLTGVIDPTSHEGVGGTLAVSADGSYQLMLTVTPFLYYLSGRTTEIAYSACSGRTKKIVSTTDPNLEPAVSGTFENAVVQVNSPSVPVSFLAVDDGQLVEGRIEGGDEIVELEVPARSRAVVRLDGSDVQKYIDKTTSRWSLKKVSVCDDVEEALRGDLALLMAYHSSEPMTTAMHDNLSKDEYENLVDNLAGKIYMDEWNVSDPPPTSGEPSVDMGVDDHCKLSGDDKMRQAREENCEHEIIIESLLAHEQKHVDQCRNQRDLYLSKSAEALSRLEVEAYCVGIGRLLAWLKMNCSGNYDSYDEIYFGICG